MIPPDYCPVCGDIMEEDDVTGEVRCMRDQDDDHKSLEE